MPGRWRCSIVLSVVCLAMRGPDSAAQSARPGWGATPYAGVGGTGVTFRVWASNASSVTVAGSFNGWNMSANPLVRESSTTGVWSADIPAARASNSYKYVVNGSLWRTDPRSRLVNSADNNNSVIVGTNSFNWEGDSLTITNARDLVIYEAHVGTFVGPSGTFTTFTNKLDYLRDLGVSAIELMPINEFPSATSWGYNPAYPFAVETSYGSPDALRELVKRGHQRGLVTVLDVVHNHWDELTPSTSLWQFDGWTPDGIHGGQYFYNTEPYANTPWGPRPDYSRPEVREFINDTFRMWLGEYHINGFRWDAPRHIIYTTNDVYIPEGLQAISNAQAMMDAEYPSAWNVAEDIKEISGFNSYWDFTFNWEIRSVLTQSDDSNRDMPTVARNVGGTASRVIYTDSHDTAGDLNGGTRLPTAIYAADAAGYYARKRSTLGAALVMTAPGTPMILQGQEMLETNQFSDTRAVDWTRTNAFAGITRLYRDLIRLRRNLDGVSEGLLGDSCSTYLVDNVNKLVAYSRWNSGTTGRSTVVVANFANTTRTGYPVTFPEEGTWYVHFNSDSTNYAADYGNAGSIEVIAAGSPAIGSVNIAPYSVLILSRTPRTGMLIRETAVTDLPAGDNDSVVDPGEAIRERIVLWNKSQFTATNVSAVLSCDSPGVAMAQAASVYPSMSPDGASTNTIPFEYLVSPTQVCGSVLVFRLATTFNGQVLTNVFEHVVGQPVVQPPVTNTYESSDVPKPIADIATTYSDLPVSQPGSNVISDVNVQVRLNHTYDRDLTLALQHPDGSEVILVNRRGGSGDNFGSGTGACGAVTYTVFDQGAGSAISTSTAPFAGTYRPEGTLNTFNGKAMNGTWRLRMRDSYSKNTGTNLCWSIRVAYVQQGYSCNCFSNRAPVATATNLILVGYVPTNITLSGTDADNQPLTFQTSNAPSHGLLSTVNTSTWQTLYTPAHGFAGTDTFDFVAMDGLTCSVPATIRIAVQPPADADGDGMPDSWEQANFTNATAGLPGADGDGDGMSNLEEYRANTNPDDSNSVLRVSELPATSAWFTVRWSSVGGTRYGLEYGASPMAFEAVPRPPAAEIDPAAKGATSTMSFTDNFTLTPPLGSNGMRVYRVRVLNR